ncbi:MAG TPA: hypothetical protein VFN35_20015 [Ktedonobacteraceae bacterium]|nr:hypothetical protein [Ktedonobacteraceae bacterium]
MGLARSLNNRTGSAVQGKCRRYAIGPRPGTIEAGFRRDLLTRRDGRIARAIGDGHRAPLWVEVPFHS